MIRANDRDTTRIGVTGVTLVKGVGTLMQQGFRCHTFLSHLRKCHTFLLLAVTPFFRTEIGVTKRCDTERRVLQGFARCVTHVTPVTPFLEGIL